MATKTVSKQQTAIESPVNIGLFVGTEDQLTGQIKLPIYQWSQRPSGSRSAAMASYTLGVLMAMGLHEVDSNPAPLKLLKYLSGDTMVAHWKKTGRIKVIGDMVMLTDIGHKVIRERQNDSLYDQGLVEAIIALITKGAESPQHGIRKLAISFREVIV